jgi:hypothetical protein
VLSGPPAKKNKKQHFFGLLRGAAAKKPQHRRFEDFERRLLDAHVGAGGSSTSEVIRRFFVDNVSGTLQGLLHAFAGH